MFHLLFFSISVWKYTCLVSTVSTRPYFSIYLLFGRGLSTGIRKPEKLSKAGIQVAHPTPASWQSQEKTSKRYDPVGVNLVHQHIAVLIFAHTADEQSQ